LNLYDLIDKVKDQKSFLFFVKALLQDKEEEVSKNQSLDLCGRGANGWENHTIESFLAAAIAWAEDSDFGKNNKPELKDNPWQQFANFLLAGKSYE